MIDVMAEPSLLVQMEVGVVLYATQKIMTDIIPLEVSRIAQLKVYTLQVIIYTIAKALNRL